MAAQNFRVIFTESAWEDSGEVVRYWTDRDEPERGEQYAYDLPTEAIRQLSDPDTARAGRHLRHTAYPETQELLAADSLRRSLAAVCADATLSLMKTTDLPIKIDRERIARFCSERGIRSLSLFGSAVRGGFEPNRSDVDVLAEFEPGALQGVGLNYFGFADELGEILGQRVDFCSQLHPVLRERVDREAVKVYERP